MKAKTKIMQVITELKPGGAELLLLKICSGLIQKDKNFDIKVVVFENKLDLAHEFERHGIEVICLDVEHRRFLTKILRTYKILKKYKPDIVHSHLLNVDRYVFIAAFLAGIENRVCTAHNMEPQTSRQDKFSRFIASIFARNIIAVSNCAREFYISNKFYPEEKIKVIHNCPGFYPGNNRPRYLPKNVESIKLVNIGKFKIQKGQIYLIRAMKELQDSPYRFRLEIYGRGIYESVLRDEVSRLKLKNVFFEGVNNKIKNILNNSHIMITPSLWEGMPLTLLEAISVGIPIIATDIESHLEVLEGVDMNIFIEPKSPKAIASAVKKIVSNPDLYHKISQQEIVRSQQFTISKTVDKYHDFYTSLVD